MVSNNTLQIESDDISDGDNSDGGLSYVSDTPADSIHPHPVGNPQTAPQPASTHKSQPAVLSAMRKGLDEIRSGGEQRGLFKYFGQGTKETFKAHIDHETERSKMYLEEEAHHLQTAQQTKEDIIRERARLRKAKSRQLVRETAIRKGIRTPAGLKKRVSCNECQCIDRVGTYIIITHVAGYQR